MIKNNERLVLFRNMLRLRMIEEAIAEYYPEQEMRCPVHLSIGQEAAAVGTCAALAQEDLIVNVGDRVFFDYDSADLDADAQELLQAQAAWLKQNNKSSIIIEGHCDERGTREYNLALGERRAQAVKNYLNGLGVSASSMSTISYGKERPAVVGSNDDAWGQNRRSVTKVNN